MTSTPSIPTPIPTSKDIRDLYTEKHVTWVVDKTLLEGTFTEQLPKVIIEHGYRLITFNGHPASYDLMDTPYGFMDEGSGPIIAYGCHSFIKKVLEHPWFPGAYPQSGDELDNLYAPRYMTKYPQDMLFNKNYVLIPISSAIRNFEFFFKIFNTNHVFIKDVAVFKRFSAKVANKEEFVRYLTLYKETHHIDDDSLVLISDNKHIFSEHRFVAVGGKIVAHSTYRWNNVLDIRIDVPQEALNFAQKLANIWSPCPAYTIDVAMNNEGPKLLELNSFSCAGLYACDLNAVVEAVSKRAREDYFERTPYN